MLYHCSSIIPLTACFVNAASEAMVKNENSWNEAHKPLYFLVCSFFSLGDDKDILIDLILSHYVVKGQFIQKHLVQ